LSGASSFTGAVTDGGGTLTISGGTFGSATSDIEVGNGVASVVFSITGGTVTARNFNIADLANSTGDSASITGGSATFNAVNLASVANTGANLTINTIGTVDSSANSSVANTSGGLIITAGTVTATSFIAASTTAQRPSDLNLNGGSLTISAATGGFELATGAGNGFLTQSGGTLSYLGSDGLLMNTVGANVSAATISGGTATLTGITLNQVNAASGVTSSLTLSGGATLYLGSVGLVINQPSGTVLATLGTSTVGAIADWSSSAPITLTGTPVTFQAANSSAVAHNITLSGILSGAGALTKTGSGTLTLSGPNTYGGATTVSSGTLALSGSGSLASSLISVAGGATFDVTGLSSTFALGSSQTLSNRASATGIINGSVTTSSGSTVALSFVAGTPALTVAGGTLTLDPATTFNVNNTGSPLTSHTYKLISKTGGTVAASGALPAVTVGGAGIAPGTSASLSIAGGELYLVVNHAPVANSFTLAASVGTPVKVAVVPKFATDPDGDTLTLTIASAPTNTAGSAVVDATGSNITYTVSSATSGPGDSFTYTATDAYGAATTGTVTVTINQTGQSYNMLTAPVLNNGKVTMSFLGIPGYKYALDWTHSLTPPVTWLPVVTNTAAGNGILLYTNTPSGQSLDAYRTRYVAP
jgi:autotransporter-associated beta strand protein